MIIARTWKQIAPLRVRQQSMTIFNDLLERFLSVRMIHVPIIFSKARLQVLRRRIRSKPPFMRFTEHPLLERTTEYAQTATQSPSWSWQVEAVLFLEWVEVRWMA